MTKLQKARLAVSLYFLIGGSAIGIWAVHIPLIEANLKLSHATIGVVLLLLGGGAFVAMQALGWVIDHYGSRWPTILGGIALAVAMIGPAIATNFVSLAIAVFFFGAGLGSLDIAMNAHAVLLEKEYGRPIFSAFHALWSAGGIVGGAVGALTLALSWTVQFTLPLTAAVLAVSSGILGVFLLNDKPNVSKQADTAKRATESASNRRVLLFILLLGLMSGGSVISEGSAVDWSAIHLTTVLHTSASIAAFGLVAFSLAMTASRLVTDRIVAKFGRYFMIQWGSLIGVAGLALVVFVPDTGAVLIGWFILGAGIGGVVPQLFAASAEAGEESHSTRNMAKVVGMTYAGILAGPAIIGFLTAFMPLNLALGIGLILCLLVFISAPLLEKLAKTL
jgi:MFS family permease